MKDTTTIHTAPEMLNTAHKTMIQRGEERDCQATGERSMKSCVAAFNAMYDTNLTETQGWQFMVLLKMSRAKGGNFKDDDYVDGAAYFALAGESHDREDRVHNNRRSSTTTD